MKEKIIRIIMTALGVCVGGISVGLFKMANFGVDPFQCLMAGLDLVVPINFGTLYVIINVCMLTLVFAFAKKYIGLATFINLFLLGYIIDFSHGILMSWCPEPTMVLRIAFFVVGILVFCFASAVYFTANLGVSTYDAVALVLSDKKVAKFRYCRIGTDLICVLVGFFLGYIPGVGTIITAFFMGPLIDMFRIKVSDPWLKKFQ